MGYARTDRVEVEGLVDVAAVRDESGREVPFQMTVDGKLIFFSAGIPAMGHKVFYYETGLTKQKTAAWDGSFVN